MADDTRRRPLTFSSEYRVKRWFGIEILDHNPKSVRMDFMKSGRAPLLMGHDQRLVVGKIESATLDAKSRKGQATARFGRNAMAADALRDVDDEILVNVSTGYRVHEMVLEKQTDAEDTYRITDWEPLEASLVGIPADPDVGMGRAAETEVREVVIEQVTTVSERSSSSTTAQVATGVVMTETVTAAAGNSAEVRITAIEAEKSRREAIGKLCKANKIDSRVESGWIADGVPLEDSAGTDGRMVKGIASHILDVIEERGKSRPALAAELGLSGSEARKYSLFRAIRALKFGGQRHLEAAGFEMECSAALAKKLNRQDTTSILVPAEVLTRSLPVEVMQRALATTPGASGGYLVNVENMGFIDILRNRSVLRTLGARTLSGLEGNVVLARQTGKPSVTWQGGEGVSVTAADQTLGQLSMTPKTAIVITDVSEQLLRQSNPSAEAFVMADLAADIAIDGVDAAGINGTGGSQPLGVKNTTGITSAQDAATFSYLKALAFPVAAGAVNAIRGNPGWVTNIAGAAVCMQRQRFTSTDSPLWQGNLLDGQLVGFRAMSSEQLASGNLIFGSWDELVIGEWGVLELATDNGGTRFNTAQVGIRAMWMVDILLRYPQAFVVSTNLS